MVGSTMASDRQAIWARKRLFFLTPHVMKNDLCSEACPAAAVKCLVVDEAHKAMGNYSYCQVVKQLVGYSRQFRVLALSATPGNDRQSVQQVLNNLLISRVELRSEDSPDILPYSHERVVEKIVVELDEELSAIRVQYLKVLEVFMGRLSRIGAMTRGDVASISKYQVLLARDHFRKNPPAHFPGSRMGAVEGDFALCVSLYHGFELLLHMGSRSLLLFLKSILDGGKVIRSVTTEWQYRGSSFMCFMYLQKLPSFCTASSNRRSYMYKQYKSKIALYCLCILRLFTAVVFLHSAASDGGTEGSTAVTDTRVMIFSSFRDSVQEIAEMLSRHHPLVRAMMFVGQSSSSGKATRGFTQKEQVQVVKRFRHGGYNTLVATCVGEEGLDIGEVDLIVCFDAQKSPVRLVQRMGRTGRRRHGRIVVILAHGREERMYNQCQSSRKSIYKAIEGASTSFQLYPYNPRMVPAGLSPAPHRMHLHVPKFDGQTKGKGRLSRTVAEASTTLSEGLLTRDEQDDWERRVRPHHGEKNKNRSIPRSHFPFAAERRAGDDHVWELSLCNYVPWQTKVQETYALEHSEAACLPFIRLMTLVDKLKYCEGQCSCFTLSCHPWLKLVSLQSGFCWENSEHSSSAMVTLPIFSVRAMIMMMSLSLVSQGETDPDFSSKKKPAWWKGRSAERVAKPIDSDDDPDVCIVENAADGDDVGANSRSLPDEEEQSPGGRGLRREGMGTEGVVGSATHPCGTPWLAMNLGLSSGAIECGCKSDMDDSALSDLFYWYSRDPKENAFPNSQRIDAEASMEVDGSCTPDNVVAMARMVKEFLSHPVPPSDFSFLDDIQQIPFHGMLFQMHWQQIHRVPSFTAPCLSGPTSMCTNEKEKARPPGISSTIDQLEPPSYDNHDHHRTVNNNNGADRLYLHNDEEEDDLLLQVDLSMLEREEQGGQQQQCLTPPRPEPEVVSSDTPSARVPRELTPSRHGKNVASIIAATPSLSPHAPLPHASAPLTGEVSSLGDSMADYSAELFSVNFDLEFDLNQLDDDDDAKFCALCPSLIYSSIIFCYHPPRAASSPVPGGRWERLGFADDPPEEESEQASLVPRGELAAEFTEGRLTPPPPPSSSSPPSCHCHAYSALEHVCVTEDDECSRQLGGASLSVIVAPYLSRDGRLGKVDRTKKNKVATFSVAPRDCRLDDDDNDDDFQIQGKVVRVAREKLKAQKSSSLSSRKPKKVKSALCVTVQSVNPQFKKTQASPRLNLKHHHWGGKVANVTHPSIVSILSSHQGSGRQFLDEEAELSEEGASSVSSDERSDAEGSDSSMREFINDASTFTQGMALNESAMHGVYLKSVQSPTVQAARYKLSYKPFQDIFSQVHEQEESYLEDSFCVSNDVDEEEAPCLSDKDDTQDLGLTTAGPGARPNEEEEEEGESSFVDGKRRLYRTRRQKQLDLLAPRRECGDRFNGAGAPKRRRILVQENSSSDEDDKADHVTERLLGAVQGPDEWNDNTRDTRQGERPSCHSRPGTLRASLEMTDVTNVQTPVRRDAQDRSMLNFDSRLSSVTNDAQHRQACSTVKTGAPGKTAPKPAMTASSVATPVDQQDELLILEVVTFLRQRLGVHAAVLQGVGGDYVVSRRMAVKRAATGELAGPAGRSRVAARVRALQERFERVCVIAERERPKPGGASRPQVRTRCLDAALAGLAAADVQVLFSSGPIATATLLQRLALAEQRKGVGVVGPAEPHPHERAAFAFYCGLPGVSYVTALGLCRGFRSVQHALASSASELRARVGMSDARAERLHQFLRYPFDPIMLP
uniref:FA complementation group M n=1 Tax=Petromyzon marinus TaxID=7757 RepID=S4RJA5_PETMA